MWRPVFREQNMEEDFRFRMGKSDDKRQEESMSVSVRIPTPLRSLTGGEPEVPVEGGTVQELIDNLERGYSGIKERICDEEGKLRRFVNLYLNDEDIRFMKDLDTEVNDGDILSIVPAIAGG